jgi:hypothetical protein
MVMKKMINFDSRFDAAGCRAGIPCPCIDAAVAAWAWYEGRTNRVESPTGGPGGNTMDDPASNLLYDAQMPGDNYTYRAYREDWVGTPYYPPSIALTSKGGSTTVYASWNGATEIKTWEVFGGRNARALVPVTSAAKAGFETSILVASAAGPFFQVKALNADGDVIGVSSVMRAW